MITSSTYESNVPDSSPGPLIVSGAAGSTVFEPSSFASAAAASQVLKPVDSGPVRAYRSAKERQVIAVFAGLVMTVMPSYAILSSTYSMPAALQASASSCLILREASEMSVSPLQKRPKPSPVPGPSILASKPGLASVKYSATLVEIGSTVDEPDTMIEPVTAPPGADEGSPDIAGCDAPADAEGLDEAPPLHAPTANAATRASAPIRLGDVIVTGWFLLVPSGAARRVSGRRVVRIAIAASKRAVNHRFAGG